MHSYLNIKKFAQQILDSIRLIKLFVIQIFHHFYGSNRCCVQISAAGTNIYSSSIGLQLVLKALKNREGDELLNFILTWLQFLRKLFESTGPNF